MSEYDSHGDLVLKLQQKAGDRCRDLTEKLKEAFSEFIRVESVEVVFFAEMSVDHLAAAFQKYPLVLKPILVSCNIAARAIERDLNIKNVDTYSPRLTEKQAGEVAAYIKQFLPPYIAIPALCSLDQHFYIDKEMRASKGRWEAIITEALNKYAKEDFKKRKFDVDGQKFELDAASPPSGLIAIGIDVKRIEARRDIHKRCDEIINKAAKFKVAFPSSKFAAVIYYPFIDEHLNVQSRLKSKLIDIVVFAGTGTDSIANAVQTLLIAVEHQKLTTKG